TKRPRRDHDAAIIHACQLKESSSEEQKKSLFIIDALHLEPMAIISKTGVESNALAHPRSIQQAVIDPTSLETINAGKRTFYALDETKNSCGHCCVQNPVELQQLICDSPFRSLLESRSFVELTTPLCALLNKDWLMHPQMKHATARLLAGAVLLNASNGHGIMMNTIEVY
ncbi:hypothetical protein BC940DRAFT_223003, partial [Gongronella butleri]